MNLLAFDKLVVPQNRQRKKFDEKKLEELAESIQRTGLLHPPVVRADGVTLVAGHRRSKAMAYLSQCQIPFKCNGETIPSGMMPVLLTSDLSAIQLKEAELEENLIREDLTWQEETMALAELTELRRSNDPNWTPKDTAREVDGSDEPTPVTYAKARDAEILKDYMDDPDVVKAKSGKEAVKILRKKAKAKTNALLAETHRSLETKHQVIHGDMREVLPTLPDNTFSTIVTDPPYGVNAHEFGDMADNAHQYDDTPENALALVEFLAKEGLRVTKAQAHAYVFCDIRMWPQFKKIFEEAGWAVWNTPLLWIKSNGMLPHPEHGPRRCYEAIMYALKGNKKVTAVYPDTIPAKDVARVNFGAEKPSALFRNLLSRSVTPGDKVLDCFAGAGPIIPASTDCDVTATAIEMNEEKYNHILTRLEERTKDDEPGADTALLDDLLGEEI